MATNQAYLKPLIFFKRNLTIAKYITLTSEEELISKQENK